MIAMSTTIEIDSDLMKTVKRIAKNRRTNENELINELITNGLCEMEEEIEILAAELGQSKEQLSRDLNEAQSEIDAGLVIKGEVKSLTKKFGN